MSGSSSDGEYCSDCSWCWYWYERRSHGKRFANAQRGGKSGSDGAIAGVVCPDDYVRCPLRRAHNSTLTNTKGNGDMSGRTACKKDTMQDIALSRKEFARRAEIYELSGSTAITHPYHRVLRSLMSENKAEQPEAVILAGSTSSPTRVRNGLFPIAHLIDER